MRQSSLLILLVLMAGLCTAQISMNYSIGCVGGSDLKMTSFSEPVAITGNACFQLSNGVRLFGKIKDGFFTNSCAVNGTAATIIARKFDLIAFPNPVITSVTIKSRDVLPVSEKVTATLYAMTGAQVKFLTTNTSSLNAGLVFNMFGLAPGTYIMKVASLSAAAEFKLIKLD